MSVNVSTTVWYCIDCEKDEKRGGGDAKRMIAAGDALIFDEDRVKSAFNFGNGTEKDLRRYIANNRKYMRFYDLENNCFC